MPLQLSFQAQDSKQTFIIIPFFFLFQMTTKKVHTPKKARHGETEAQKRNKFSLTFPLVNNIGFGHFHVVFQVFLLKRTISFLSTMFFKRDCRST